MARHLIISGIVQGVGYRASFAAQAHALKLSGWVRNRLDGTVEAVVSGEPNAVETIIGWARRGPPSARVEQVVVTDADDVLAKNGSFQMLPTA